jgi:hypothetical protein
MLTLLTGFFLLLAVQDGAGQSVDDQPEPDDPIDRAYFRFVRADPEEQIATIAAIGKRLELSEEAGMRKLLTWITRAKEELAAETVPALSFHDPEIYTPGLWPRRFLDGSDSNVELQTGLFCPWDSKPGIAAAAFYDFGNDRIRRSGFELAPDAVLFELLKGYAPDSDILLAWVTWKLDYDDSVDALARHFDHAYCDLYGGAYPEVTIYDAFASREKMAMPDVDVIAYARNIRKDFSYVSPLPPNARRARLYDNVRDGFVRIFRYRCLIEAVAEVTINPEAELRPTHRPLRDRILYMLSIDEGDLGEVRKRLERTKTREGFIKDIDGLVLEDRDWERKIQDYRTEANSVRWVVAIATQDELHARGFLE